MNVPTLMINPDPNFTRSNIFQGSAIVKNPEEINNALSQLFNDNNDTFYFQPEILENRNAIIKNSIGFDDGFNHLRVIKAIKPFLGNTNKSNHYSLNFGFLKKYLLLHAGKLFYNKYIFQKNAKLKKTIWIFENYKLEKIKAGRQKAYNDLDKFYLKNKISSNSELDLFMQKL